MILKRQSNPIPDNLFAISSASPASSVSRASGLSSIQPLASSFQNSTRNTRENRTRLNSPGMNNLIFSTRNKTGGVADLCPRKSRRGRRLGISRNPSAVAGLLREGGSRISNRDDSGNRNRRNSMKINVGHHF